MISKLFPDRKGRDRVTVLIRPPNWFPCVGSLTNLSWRKSPMRVLVFSQSLGIFSFWASEKNTWLLNVKSSEKENVFLLFSDFNVIIVRKSSLRSHRCGCWKVWNICSRGMKFNKDKLTWMTWGTLKAKIQQDKVGLPNPPKKTHLHSDPDPESGSVDLSIGGGHPPTRWSVYQSLPAMIGAAAAGS